MFQPIEVKLPPNRYQREWLILGRVAFGKRSKSQFRQVYGPSEA